VIAKDLTVVAEDLDVFELSSLVVFLDDLHFPYTDELDRFSFEINFLEWKPGWSRE